MTRTKISKHAAPERRTRVLGVGTVVTVLGLIAVVVGARWHDMHTSDPRMGRIVYQADAAGKLLRVGASTQQPMLPPRLWKPEVGLLLSHAGQLHLSINQKQFMTRQDTLWTAEKQAMEHVMEESTANLASASDEPSHRAVSVGQLSSSLQDYSTISTRYDGRRRHYWDVATSILTPAQRTALAAIESAGNAGQKD